MITIEWDERQRGDVVSMIIVPDKALTEAGYIQTITVNADASSKHEFHAMAQMAFYQYQDEELVPEPAEGSLRITRDGDTIQVPSGMVLFRDEQGGFNVIVHSALNSKKMLEAAFRYCTRWVRLDI